MTSYSHSSPLKASPHALDVEALSVELGSVTRAGRVLGFGWANSPRVRPPRPARHHLPSSVEAKIVQLSVDRPHFGPVRVVNELARQRIRINATDVGLVWTLHDLGTQEKRLAAQRRASATWPLVARTHAAPPTSGRVGREIALLLASSAAVAAGLSYLLHALV